MGKNKTAIAMIDPEEGNDLLQFAKIQLASINGLSEQMGIVTQSIKTLNGNVREVSEKVADMDGRLEHLEDDQFVDLIKADNIRLSAQNKVAQLLSIEFDERGGVADESMYYDYKKYFGKFVGRLHVDARHAGLEGPRIYATPRKNYQALIDFINEWVPKRGVDGLKSYYDGLEAARRAKRKKAHA